MHNFIDAPGGNADIFRSLYWLIFIGLRNSSSKISPGWMGQVFFLSIFLKKEYIFIRISDNLKILHHRRFLVAK